MIATFIQVLSSFQLVPPKVKRYARVARAPPNAPDHPPNPLQPSLIYNAALAGVLAATAEVQDGWGECLRAFGHLRPIRSALTVNGG